MMPVEFLTLLGLLIDAGYRVAVIRQGGIWTIKTATNQPDHEST